MKCTRIVAKFALLALVAGAAGCAGDPVNPRMPFDNPASPEASEAKFVMPPNPFQEELPGPVTKPEDSPGIDHSTHDRPVDRPTDHPAGHGNKASSPGSSQDQTGMHMHGGHTQ